jgi:F-type H+-transporting ATPase subunit epsilon
VSEEKSSSTLNLKVLTPDGPVLEGEVYEVSIPGTLGEMGIFPQHAALLTGIIPGKLAYRAPDGDDTAAVGRGVAEVQNNEVRILVNQAMLREEINTADLETRRTALVEEVDKESHADRLKELEEELLLLDVQLQIAKGTE